MRTGPFSSSQVIERLNAYFVPVYVVNEDYAEDGPAPEAEKAERNRIYRESLAAGFSTGTVHVYTLDPAGTPIGTLHVAEAAKTDVLLELLDRVIAELGVSAGQPLVPPRPQSRPPEHEPGSLVLHLAARGLGGGGSWDGTAENWVIYTADEIKRLLPATDTAVGDTWKPDPELVERLLRYVYPVTENNDPAKNKVLHQELTARVLAADDGVCRVRLDGRLRMQHDFYHKPDGKVVETGLVGYVDFDPRERRIKRLRLVTHNGTYGGGRFGVAVRSEAARYD
jgi:hypothetical protein